MTSPIDLLFQRLIQIDQSDPETAAARLQDPETTAIRLAALPRPGASPEEIAQNIEAQRASPYRAAMVSAAAVRHDILSLFLAAAEAWLDLYEADAHGAAAQRLEIALHVIEEEGGFEGDKHAAASELQEALRRWMGTLRGVVAPIVAKELHPVHRLAPLLEQQQGAILPTPPTPIEPPWTGDVLALDDAFAALVRETGEQGMTAANSLRDSAAARAAKYRAGQDTAINLFRLWLPSSQAPGARFALHLARCLWLDGVCKLAARQRQRPLALARPVYASPVVLMHSGTTLVEEPNGQRLLSAHEGGVTCRIALTDARLFERIRERIRSGVGRLGSVLAHRLIRWQVATGYQQFLERERDASVDARVIEVVGGYSAIGRLIDSTSGNDIVAIREIIAAQNACEFDFPWAHDGGGQSGRLLILEEIGAAKGRPAKVRLVLGTMLLPAFADLLKHQEGLRGSHIKLVPITDMPPLLGSTNKHGAQVSLSMRLVLLLRDRAAELYEEGSVSLRSSDLQRLAREVGLDDDPKFLGELWERWQTNEHQPKKGPVDKTPAFIKCEKPDRFTLGDHHAAARQSILDAGASEVAGSINGQRGQARRKDRQARLLGGR